MKPGKSIMRLRKLKGYSVSFMALELGITRETYQSIESDSRKITIANLEAIAKLLEAEISEFLIPDGRGEGPAAAATREELYFKLMDSQDELIEALQKELEVLKMRIARG